MYEQGKGVRQDYQKAKGLFEKAAAQGFAKAQTSLGSMYIQGKGVRKNLATAKEWFGMACDNGNQTGCDYYARLNSSR